jgi:glucan biosynthesis protein C
MAQRPDEAARRSTSEIVAPPLQGRASPASSSRLLFIDNVRWAMIVLVLSMHAAVTYSPVGAWYYTEHPKIGPISTLFFVTYQGVLQGFFMALLFFIAGYFAVRSYDAKGAGAFIAGRLYRLGLPTLLYVALLGPVTEYYVAHSWRTHQSFAHEMGLYFVRGRFLSGTGPMWFCAALLIFCGVYTLYRRLAPASRPERLASQWRPSPAAAIALTVGVLALSTFLTRLAMPLGSSVFNMQLCYLSDRHVRWAAGVCIGAAMLMWLPLLVLGGALQGERQAYAGGAHWQAAALSVWEALICVGLSIAVLSAFRTRFAGQGRIAKFMSDNAFAVYVIHPPILIGLALMLSGVAIAPVAKFALLWALGVAVCFGVAAPLARRMPFVGRVLS